MAVFGPYFRNWCVGGSEGGSIRAFLIVSLHSSKLSTFAFALLSCVGTFPWQITDESCIARHFSTSAKYSAYVNDVSILVSNIAEIDEVGKEIIGYYEVTSQDQP